MDASAPQELRIVFRTRRQRALREHSLVLEAMGIAHFHGREGPELLLLVDDELEGAALEQLAAYQRERRTWTHVPEVPASWRSGVYGALGFAFALALVNALDWVGALGLGGHDAGVAIAARIRAGEWQRALTALTLHADAAHLVSNIVFGGLFCGALAAQIGAPLAWWSCLLSGFAGNLLNAWSSELGHRSLGASTAVFGLVGVLVAIELLRLWRTRMTWFRRWAALAMGLFLFAWLGLPATRIEDPLAREAALRVDVMAHAWGLLSGLACGPLIARAIGRLGTRASIALGCAAALALAIAWWIALA